MKRNKKKQASNMSTGSVSTSTKTKKAGPGGEEGGPGDDGQPVVRSANTSQEKLRRSKRRNSPLDCQGGIIKIKTEDNAKRELVEDESKNTGRKKRMASVKRGAPKKKVKPDISDSEEIGIVTKKTIKRNLANDKNMSEDVSRESIDNEQNDTIAKKKKSEKQRKRSGRNKNTDNDEKLPLDIGRQSKVKKEVKKEKEMVVEEKVNDGSDESDDDDWEEVAELEGVIESPVKHKLIANNKTIEITLDDGPNNKRRKKQDEWEDYVRREINRYNKEQQIAVHKAHLLCLLALGRYHSSVCSSSMMQALCLSIIPNKFTETKQIDISFFVRFVRWFQSQFKVNSAIKEVNKKNFNEVLCSRFEKFEVANETEFVHIFASILQCIQLNVRIIFSLQPVSLKSAKVIKKPNQKSPLPCLKDTTRSNTKQRKKLKQKKETANGALTSSRQMRTKNISRRKSASKVAAKDDLSDTKVSSNPDSDEDWTMVRQKRTRKKKKNSNLTTTDSDSDFEPHVMNITKCPKSGGKKKSKMSNDLSDSDESVEVIGEVKNKNLQGLDVWLEVFLESDKKWICIDCIRGIINHPEKCEGYATQPVTYILAFSSRDGSIKDLTKKYASKWMTHTRKQRIDHTELKWWQATLKPFRTNNDDMQDAEDQQLQANLLNKPMPTSVSEFKNHPLYALKRHLLKFEAIYPESATILGYCRGEPVYSRDCVHQLHAKEAWIKEARVVRVGEEPYKLVKARPKPRQRKTAEVLPPLPIYGYWQTEEYIAPPAVDGKVPRNEHGNVELYKKCMLPVGTVHLQLPGLNKVARKLDIDCAPAMVGWDFHGGYNHPVFDGVIVCEEFKETLVDAWQQEQIEIERKKSEKREQRALKNWRHLTKALLIRERLKRRFQSSYEDPDLTTNENATDVTMAWPLNRNMQNSKDRTHLFPFEKL